MGIQLSKEFIARLLEAPDYRSFIDLIISEKNKRKKFGYADVARLGGFASRSFPRDVVRGEKRITLNSLPGFMRALYLTSDISEYFRMMVELEHEDCRAKTQDEVKLRDIKIKYKERIISKFNSSKNSEEQAFQISSIPEVYAALGSVERGATLKEIYDRSHLPSHEIETALEKMIATGLVLKKKLRYFPRQTHLNFEGLSQSEVFKKHFISGCERSARMARSGLSSDSKLFLSSAFSVNRSDLPKLKEELRSLLLKFVDNSEQTDGDKVVNFVASLY